jgi:hypothetical protein
MPLSYQQELAIHPDWDCHPKAWLTKGLGHLQELHTMGKPLGFAPQDL